MNNVAVQVAMEPRRSSEIQKILSFIMYLDMNKSGSLILHTLKKKLILTSRTILTEAVEGLFIRLYTGIVTCT